MDEAEYKRRMAEINARYRRERRDNPCARTLEDIKEIERLKAEYERRVQKALKPKQMEEDAKRASVP